MNQKTFKSNALRSLCFVFAITLFSFVFNLKAEGSAVADVQQSATVTGIVTSSDGETLIGVTVVVKGEKIGIITDHEGKYSINIPSPNAILTFSYIGFAPKEIVVGKKRVINVTLDNDDKLLSEVVVVAYGTQRKETVTGAIASIQGKTLRDIPAANITNTLAGKMPGVTVSQNKGRPGDDAAKIYIRGRTSWGDSSPLIVIDGIEQERFDQLDANEIESISVLKDASSTAVYGIRGANGVILITTRRGVLGNPKINLSANWSRQNPNRRPEFLGSHEHMLLKRKAYDNDGRTWDLNMSDEALEGFRTGSNPYLYPDVNWYDLMLKDVNNPMQQYNLNVSGGTQRVKYFVGFGYLDQRGALNYQDMQKDYNPETYFKRINFRSNLDLTVNKFMTVTANISGRSEEINGVKGISGSTSETGGGSGGFYQSLLAREPWQFSVFNPDGSIGRILSSGNPIADAAFGGYQNKRMNYFDIITSLKNDLDFVTQGLTLNLSISYNNSFGSQKEYSDGVDTYYYDPVKETYDQISEDTPFNFSKEEMQGAFKRTAIQLNLGYTRTFGVHRTSGILIYNQQKTVKGKNIAYMLMGYAARGEYSYANKYLVEASMGYNGSENFAKGHRFGFFPAASLGYVITEEKFMEPIRKILPYFKIRGSIGLIGNDKGPAAQARWLYMAEYAGINSPTNSGSSWIFGTTNPTGTGGIYEKRGQNFDITWETAFKRNIGIEGRLFKNNMFSFAVDIFDERRKDILMQGRSTSVLIGIENPYGNIGETKGWGHEIEVMHRNKIQNVEYSIRGVYSFARNKIINRDDSPYTPEYQKMAGKRIGQLSGYNVLGFFQNEDEIKNSPDQTTLGGKVIPGDLKYQDMDEDGKITSNDMVPIGYSSVPEITYSISPTVSWKGISLSCMFQGVANASVLFSGNAMYEFAGSSGGGQVSKIHRDYWTPDNPNPTYPSLHYDPVHGNKNPNSFLMQTGNFIKLRDLKLSYDIPANLCKKIGMSSMQLYVNGTNLHTWTDMYNWDPETINSDGDYFPQQKVYNIGVNINF